MEKGGHILIIWQGWGIAAPLMIILITFGFTELICFFTTNTLYLEVAISVGCALSAIPCWLLGCYLNNKLGHTYIDVKTKKEFTIKKVHSCFFIKLQYWAFIALFFAIFLAALFVIY